MTKCRVALGGTFSVLHRGHRSLLDKACSIGDMVVIGLTSNSYVKTGKIYEVPDYQTRKRNLENYLNELNCPHEIIPLNSRTGSAVSRDDLCAIVVSHETLSGARIINSERKRNGLKELPIVTVPTVLSDDLFPMSSSRIMRGDIDEDGRCKSPVRVVISTRNQLKIRVASEALKEIFHEFEIMVNSSYETVDQPFGDDTVKMAMIRARSARDFHYSIAVESGLFHDRNTSTYYDVHVCALLDLYGNMTVGYSSGFQVPPELVGWVKTGMDESQAFFRMHGEADIGSKGGVVRYLSDGRLDRESLIREAIRNAFIPRYRPYEFGLRFQEPIQR